ncbi:MAG TPA: ABC transporter permease, partial [Vicinamibacterales bacterium]
MSLFLTSIRLASRALARNTLRTLLTMLGMIIGVGAVVTMAALGNGAQRSVETDVRSAGTNLIQVRAGNFTRGGDDSNIPSGLGAATTLIVADADAVRREVAGLKRVAETVRLRGWVVAGDRRFYAQVAGTGSDFPPIYGWPLSGGRFYDTKDVASRAKVALLGSTVQERLFESGAGVGRTITIRDQPFTVVGLPRTTDEDHNETVFVPYTALQD